MRQTVWQKLDEDFNRFPMLCASAVPRWEIIQAEKDIGFSFPIDFVDFVEKYGGAIVGSRSVVGLRDVATMGNGMNSVVELTRDFRNQGWLGTDKWMVFSMDLAGNPIGFDKDGKVWISDHDFGGICCIAQSFEDYIVNICLAGQ